MACWGEGGGRLSGKEVGVVIGAWWKGGVWEEERVDEGGGGWRCSGEQCGGEEIIGEWIIPGLPGPIGAGGRG